MTHDKYNEIGTCLNMPLGTQLAYTVESNEEGTVWLHSSNAPAGVHLPAAARSLSRAYLPHECPMMPLLRKTCP